MRVIVTGARGFIGSHLCHFLESFESKRYEIVKTSRSDRDIDQYRNTPSGEVLIHLAENNNRHQVNVLGKSYYDDQLEVAQNICKKNYKKIIYISSMAVYNQIEREEKFETDPVGDQDLYAKTKIAVENIFLKTKKASVFRLSNVYGLGMSSHNVQSRIIEQLNIDDTVKLWSVSPKRDWIAVADICYAIEKAIEQNPFGVVNLGSGVGKSVEEMIQVIGKAVWGKEILK